MWHVNILPWNHFFTPVILPGPLSHWRVHNVGFYSSAFICWGKKTFLLSIWTQISFLPQRQSKWLIPSPSLANLQSKDLVEDLPSRVANEFYSLIITFEFINFHLLNALKSIRLIILSDVPVTPKAASRNTFKLNLWVLSFLKGARFICPRLKITYIAHYITSNYKLKKKKKNWSTEKLSNLNKTIEKVAWEEKARFNFRQSGFITLFSLRIGITNHFLEYVCTEKERVKQMYLI